MKASVIVSDVLCGFILGQGVLVPETNRILMTPVVGNDGIRGWVQFFKHLRAPISLMPSV